VVLKKGQLLGKGETYPGKRTRRITKFAIKFCTKTFKGLLFVTLEKLAKISKIMHRCKDLSFLNLFLIKVVG